MIIDLILDRKDGVPYSPKKFYEAVVGYGAIGERIAQAMDELTEEDVKRELYRYIYYGEYDPKIISYIRSVNWID